MPLNFTAQRRATSKPTLVDFRSQSETVVRIRTLNVRFWPILLRNSTAAFTASWRRKMTSQMGLGSTIATRGRV